MVLAILVLAPVAAQEPVAGPDIVVLVYHPFPDPADPLGVPFAGNCSRPCDPFITRHGGLEPFRDGVAFPGFVADGVVRDEGLEEGFEGTLAFYDEAVQQRLGEQTPVAITVGTSVVEGEVRVTVWVESTSQVGAGLHLWLALVEDPVHYRPPPALSNGVFDHPFTVRAVRDVGIVAPGPETRIDTRLALNETWHTGSMRLAAWVEQDRQALGTFQPGEVVQAVSHPLPSTALTQQVDRAVLVEGYSASWCDPCLIGDAALEALAEAHGLPTGRGADEGWRYLREPVLPVGMVAVAAAGGFALFALMRLRRPA